MEEHKENRIGRLIKVLLGGCCAAGGVFIIMDVFILLFFGDKGLEILFDYTIPIVIILTIVMSVTLMRWLK
jgi:hypothetical protein